MPNLVLATVLSVLLWDYFGMPAEPFLSWEKAGAALLALAASFAITRPTSRTPQ